MAAPAERIRQAPANVLATRPEPAPRMERRLSDEEVSHTLSGLNTEVRGLIVGITADGKRRTVPEIEQALITMQGPRPAIGFSRGFVDNHVKQLCEFQMLNRSDAGQQPTYEQADFGRERAVPSSGHLLFSSAMHESPALRDIWGVSYHQNEARELMTALGPISYADRVSLSRMKLIQELDDAIRSGSLPLRQIDIANALGVNPVNARGHIVALKRAGLLDYVSSRSQEGAYAHFKVAEELKDLEAIEPLPFKSGPNAGNEIGLMSRLWQYVKDRYYEILSADACLSYFWDIRDPWVLGVDERVVKGHINKGLAWLAKQGLLERLDFDQLHQSEVKLTADQAKMIAEIVDMLNRIAVLTPENVHTGSELLHKILHNPTIVKRLLAKSLKQKAGEREVVVTQAAD